MTTLLRCIVGIGVIAVLVGVFFLGGAVLTNSPVNPWQIGLTATALGLILMAIGAHSYRGRKQRDDLMAAIDESTETQSNHTAALIRGLRETIEAGRPRGVAVVSPVRGRGTDGDAA